MTVNICGIQHNIIECEDTFDVDTHFGQIDYKECRIKINKELAKDFKNESYGRPLSAFSLSNSISFYMDDVEGEYAVTNVLWL